MDIYLSQVWQGYFCNLKTFLAYLGLGGKMKKGKDFTLLLFLTIWIFFILNSYNPCLATEFKGGKNIFVPEDSIVDDDLVATCGNMRFDGNVTGNLIAGCQSLVQRGKVFGSVLSAGQNIDILGEVGGSVIAFAQNVNINGDINYNLIAISAALNIKHEGKINRDVSFLGGTLSVDGEIGRKLKAQCGEAVISGTINGDVSIDAEKVTLLPTAVIQGNFTYESEKEARIEEGAQIKGETSWKKPKPKEKKEKAAQNFLIYKSLSILALFLTGVVLTLLSGKFVKSAKDRVLSSFLKSLGLGFVFMVCIPIAILILLVTLIGIPLAVISIFGYLVLFYLAKVFVGMAVGEKLILALKKQGGASWVWSLLLGLIILTILTNLPYLGWIFYVVILFAGFGAALAACKEFCG